ncbi:MAG: hypothetical protein HYS12_04515 [Planctomycetes bacterium]|nr:hypothetical protein [Planctomycetota bacterium]
MAKNPRKRQQKLERRAAKRKEKKHLIAREHNVSLAEKLTATVKYPILHTWVTEDLWAQGMGWVLFSRQLPDGSIAFAAFLVDRYCLGVKNAMADIGTRSDYESNMVRKMRTEFRSEEVTPAAARKIVEGAVDYARDLGFPPHPDYHKAKLLFGDVDPAECKDEFEFGKDGKPFFVSGPFESARRSQEIVNTLMHRCGPDGFEYLVRIHPSQEIVSLDEEDDLDGYLDDEDEPEDV